MKTYRVTVRGRFGPLSDEAATSLRDEAAEHDVLAARYTPEGTVTYGPELRTLVFRCEVQLDDTEPAARTAERAAADLGRQALQAWGAERDGVAVQAKDADVTCLDDIRVRPPRRKRA